MEFKKKDLLQIYAYQNRVLGKYQREYKKLLATKFRKRKEVIVQSSYRNSIMRLRQERNVLRAQIWTANGETHQRENANNVRNVKCHVKCQERLAEDIRQYKVNIANMERVMSRLNRQVYDLNRKTVPNARHQTYVFRMRRKTAILENQYEVGVRRECGLTAVNKELRDELINMIHTRANFSDLYTKLVMQLNSEKKYLVDLIEYALNNYDQYIDVYEKIENRIKRDKRETEARKMELQSLIRKKMRTLGTLNFLEYKQKRRQLDDLQPKEYRRREAIRRQHRKKINLYNQVIDKILRYTDSKGIPKVIEKFKQQESVYYSYFNYTNEMSYHMTLLNNSVSRLFREIGTLKADNHAKLTEQVETIQRLEKTLLEKKQANQQLRLEKRKNNERLEKLMRFIQLIRDTVRADCTSLKVLLGNFEEVNLKNAQNFLKVLEERIFNITAATYVKERQGKVKSFTEYVIKDVAKLCDWTTPLDDIVLAQQCPECAEVDAFNVDEMDATVNAEPIERVKERLFEKVQQPEMQYRLHSISMCRLPRSRVLAAKTHMGHSA